jgi:NADPH-dependent 2,4-dienoyl-CoA reductase/sulfur reductase-like enzyme
MTDLNRIVIVGGSIAAVTAVGSLRSMGYSGDLVVLGAETGAPYARPPLSKALLNGDSDSESCTLQIDHSNADFLTGMCAVGLDRRDSHVILANGDRVPFDGLVIATGARARRLGMPHQNEIVVRTLDDSLSLREAMRTAASMVIVGAGFLAFEIASAAARAGVKVTIVSRSVPLHALAGPHVAELVVDAAREAGVNFVTSPAGVGLLGHERITGVEIDNGTTLTADLVVSAAGCLPNVEWLASAFDISEGLVVDERMRLTPRIVAAGDVAAWRAPGQTRPQRTPLWMSAIAQARAASASLLELDPIAIPAQYAWTELFGLDIKIAGTIPRGVAPVVKDGSLAERRVLLTWPGEGTGAAASINYHLPVARLKALARQTRETMGV